MFKNLWFIGNKGETGFYLCSLFSQILGRLNLSIAKSLQQFYVVSGLKKQEDKTKARAGPDDVLSRT